MNQRAQRPSPFVELVSELDFARKPPGGTRDGASRRALGDPGLRKRNPFVGNHFCRMRGWLGCLTVGVGRQYSSASSLAVGATQGRMQQTAEGVTLGGCESVRTFTGSFRPLRD